MLPELPPGGVLEVRQEVQEEGRGLQVLHVRVGLKYFQEDISEIFSANELTSSS